MRGHWARLLVQLAILGSMLAINRIDDQFYLTIVSLSLVILPVASWTVFALLLWTARQAPDIQSLHERVDDALTLALIASVAAALGATTLGRLTGFITIPVGSLFAVGIGFIVIEVSLPALGFLRTWRSVYLPMVRQRRGDPAEGMGFEHVELPSDDGVVRVGDGDPGRVVHVDDVVTPAGAEVHDGHRDSVHPDVLAPVVRPESSS